MASSKSSKGGEMNQAITPDMQETMGRSGMPHPPYSAGMGSASKSAPAKKAMPKRPMARGGRRR